MFHEWSLIEKPTPKSDSLPNILFHSIKLSDKCLYIWIGDFNSKLENLACSMQTPYEREPIGIEIIQPNTDDPNNNSLSRDLSIKLAKKLNKQVLVSFNISQCLLEQSIPNEEATLMQLIEKRLFQEIKQNSDNF